MRLREHLNTSVDFSPLLYTIDMKFMINLEDRFAPATSSRKGGRFISMLHVIWHEFLWFCLRTRRVSSVLVVRIRVCCVEVNSTSVSNLKYLILLPITEENPIKTGILAGICHESIKQS